jgi:putative transposase
MKTKARGPKSLAVNLTAKEEKILAKWSQSGKVEYRLRFRAQIILLASEGKSNTKIANVLNCARKTVVKWRNRFVKKRLGGLKDLPRSGRPPIFTSKQRTQIIALACKTPDTLGLPITQWSTGLLTDMVIKNRIVPAISSETVRSILNDAELKPHRWHYWLNSPDPDFEEKMLQVVDLYCHPPRGVRILSIDEKSQIQALERLAPDKPMTFGRIQLREFYYHRHGVLNLMAAFDIKKGIVFGRCFPRNRHEEFLEFLDSLFAYYADEPLICILDNLKTHKHGEVEARVAQEKGRVRFQFLPTHASWLNQVEIWFSRLQREVLRRGSFSSLPDLEKKIMVYIKWYNRTQAHPYRWTYRGYPLAA